MNARLMSNVRIPDGTGRERFPRAARIGVDRMARRGPPDREGSFSLPCYAPPELPMPNLFEEFRIVVATLGAAQVPYAVCGGLAMSIHARPRATIDIDLLAPAAAVAAMADALSPCGFVRREQAPTTLADGEIVMHRLTKIVPGDPEVLLVDVIEVRPGATERAWQTRITTAWEGHPVPVVSRAGLIQLKRLRGSPQDIADIALLEEQG